MNESRKIKVVYPNGSFKFVQINSLDIPNNLAQPCDIAKGDVFMIHNGHCLSPYLTIASQNVIDGDVIYLHPKSLSSQSSFAEYSPCPILLSFASERVGPLGIPPSPNPCTHVCVWGGGYKGTDNLGVSSCFLPCWSQGL